MSTRARAGIDTPRPSAARAAGIASMGMERLLPWLRRTGWVYLLVGLALAGIAWQASSGGRGSDGAGTQVEVGSSTAPGRDGSAPVSGRDALVHVAGAVRRPGVYELAADARVRDAVRRAGGPTARARLSALNLAAPIQDGQQVVVPGRDPGGPGPGEGPLSLSSASAEQLEDLDGIGPALAARIVEHRGRLGGFASVEQLDEVPGIGPARLEALREEVVP